MGDSLQMCSRCVYEETVPGISFDAKGVCSYCRLHDDLVEEYPVGDAGREKLDELFSEIKKTGSGSSYDCVVGVSGGCDSSFLLTKVRQAGLRPLAVHFDNTWNSTIATTNIRNVTEALDIDLHTYVVHNREYDDIYRSFFEAGLIDVEAPTDIGLATTLFDAADRFGIKYIIEGHSFRTEGISPLGWLYMDARYIADVHRKYGTRPLKTFPNLWFHKQLKWSLKGIRKVRPLYYLDYDKEVAKKHLTEHYGWQWYGGHHLENRFTAFWHRYFLPIRWGIDMRVLGFAALVRSEQMNRNEAIQELERPPYADPEIEEIVELVKKRLGYNDDDFDRIMSLPKQKWQDFANYRALFRRLKPLLWLGYKTDRITKSFYLKYTAPIPSNTKGDG